MMTFFILTSHPFFKALALLGICFSLLMILISYGGWLNYVLGLIYLGGILILFIYITSLLPNWMKKKKQETSFMNFFLVFLILLIYFPFLEKYQNENLNFLFKNIFSWVSMKLVFLIFFFMLLTLLISGNICKKIFSPLRLSLGFKLNLMKLLIFKIKNLNLKGSQKYNYILF